MIRRAIVLTLALLLSGAPIQAARRPRERSLNLTTTSRMVFFLSVGTEGVVLHVRARTSGGVEIRFRHAGPRDTSVEVFKAPEFRQEIESAESTFLRTSPSEARFDVRLRVVRAARKRARARVEVTARGLR